MEIINILRNYGIYNQWRGCVALYLTTAQLRRLKKYGITKEMPVLDAYDKLKAQIKRA